MKDAIKLSRQPERGIALVVVLAFVVLLAAMVVAFLTRTSADRQTAHGTFNQTKADQLARGALDIVTGDLKQEILNGSTQPPSTVNNITIYTPTSAANMLPARSGNPPGVPDPIPNLVRRSVREDSIASPPGVASRASWVNSTTDISLNSRSISLARWNKHYLIPRIAGATPTDTTPVASFVAPDWVIVTTNGPSPFTTWNNSLRDTTSTNYATGRYAYAVYDEGGLIDANVGGYPSPTPSPAPATYVQRIGRKGSVAFADLTALGMSTGGIGDIVGWRNYASVQPDGSFASFVFEPNAVGRYVTAVLSNTNGFMTVSSNTWNNRTDQAFLDRQALIKLRGASGFTANALQYLGTFSRELNRPTWSPSTPAGSTINYAAQAESSTAINRNLATVRVTGAFTRADGTTTVVGEPLLKTRFVLTKINALLNTGGPTIQRDFGLLWNSGQNHWDYVGATGSTVQTTIKRLDQVAAENREPNFFELLKAVILNGSVGLGSGSANTFVTSELKYYITATTPTNPLSSDYQIVQIGANIIDEWDPDNLPTFINFAGNEAAGVENLPYLNKLVFTPFFKTPGTIDYFRAWLVPSLFNPHQNATSATGTIRVALTGAASFTATGKGNNDTTITTCTPITPLPATMDVNANSFGTPSPQTTAPLASTATTVNSNGPPQNFWGFQYPFTPSTSNAALIDQQNGSSAYPDFGTVSGATNVELQVQVSAPPIWKTYQKWNIAAIGHPLACQGVKQNIFNSNKLQDPEFVALDPRTVRFGIWGSDAFDTGKGKKDYNDGGDDSMDQSKAALEQIVQLVPQGASFITSDSKANAYLYSTNTATGADYYKDLDGVVRQGDWTTGNGTQHQFTVMYGSNSSDRPRILNAPFQSVAELGQVFRDQPWKTLAFTIANSGDAGLLDAFTLQDAPMIAGRTSLNTRQGPVLAAILSQAVRGIAGTNVISAVDVTTIASRLVTITTASPMISKSELVTKLLADASLNTIWNTSTTANPWNKEARECVVRAFSDAGQTRTWNLMIDVIAQSGRYPSTATSLSQFVVEGEKRYWLHVAIDRFTGEVLDQQLEAVYE